jgi:uncharacterized membrane protein
MDKLLVVTFRDDKTAYEGVTALHQLSGTGALRLDRLAVITRNAAGVLSTESTEDDFAPPARTLAGTVLGGLIGSLGGMPGCALGAGLGGITGLVADLRAIRGDVDSLNHVAKALAPGAYAIVAEAHEVSVKSVDVRMRALGGTVNRTPKSFGDGRNVR